MLAADSYNLMYTGMTKPQHLLQAANAQAIGDIITRKENAQLSEYLLQKLKFDADIQARYSSFQVGDSRVSALRLNDYVRHIHQAKSEEIRSRFEEPGLTDDEAGEVLYKMKVKPILDEALKDAGGVVSVAL